MQSPVVWKIAAPMFALGVLLLGLGVAAAWNIHRRQREASDMVAREVHGMMVISELHITMREIRYQVNLYLRSRDRSHLDRVTALDGEAITQLDEAAAIIRNEAERRLVEQVGRRYRDFADGFRDLMTAGDRGDGAATEPDIGKLSELSDNLLTTDVLQPLYDSLKLNEQLVERMDAASTSSARQSIAAFLLLGCCGGVAGLLMGTGIARAVGRSLVQLTVTVQDVAGRLPDLPSSLTLSHSGDLRGIESRLQEMEQGILFVVDRLRRSETELMRREQLSQVGQLAAGLAHEVRNPLTPMKMLVQAAIDRGPDGTLSRRSLEVMSTEIGRMETSIRAFLDFARPPLPEKSVVDVRDLVSSTLELIRERAGRQHVTLDEGLPEEPVMATVDRGQLRQLLLNVMLNGIDAMPKGGTLRVSVTTRPSSAPAVDGVPCEPEGFSITVADEGHGIDVDDLQRVFDPFFTTKESGTGLGLTICRQIAEGHGGRLTAANGPDGGAVIELYVPTLDDRESEAAPS